MIQKSSEETNVLDESQREQVALLLAGVPECSQAQVRAIDALPGDASQRQYFRVKLSHTQIQSLILMLGKNSPGPLGGGRDGLGQDESFFLLSGFFLARDIPVPRVLAFEKEQGLLLVEDLGRFTLRDFYEQDPNVIGESYGHLAERGQLYSQAIELLVLLQEQVLQGDELPAQRSVPIEKYISEAMEFPQHLLAPLGLSASEEKVFEEFSKSLAETIRDHPACLCHFDFGAQNLVVSPDDKLHIVDFQDACLLSRSRDVYSLLNDRDIDSLLGESFQKTLLEKFLTQRRFSSLEKEKFLQEYAEYGMHWDLRVSGRFAKLQTIPGKERYAAWIPGTLRRLARQLPRQVKVFPRLDDCIEITRRLLPEFRNIIS